MCDKDVLDRITEKVCNAAKAVLGDRLEKVILYGSYARGDYDEYSDVDIFVLADIAQEDCCKTGLNILKQIRGVSLEYDILICPHVTGSATFYRYLDVLPFYTNVLKEGVELYAA
jgi:predicted nucleotidyltransferase